MRFGHQMATFWGGVAVIGLFTVSAEGLERAVESRKTGVVIADDPVPQCRCGFSQSQGRGRFCEWRWVGERRKAGGLVKTDARTVGNSWLKSQRAFGRGRVRC